MKRRNEIISLKKKNEKEIKELEEKIEKWIEQEIVCKDFLDLRDDDDLEIAIRKHEAINGDIQFFMHIKYYDGECYDPPHHPRLTLTKILAHGSAQIDDTNAQLILTYKIKF